MALDCDQPIMFQLGKSPRHNIPYRTDANSNFMVGQRQMNGGLTLHRNIGGLHFCEKKQGQSLSNFMQGQGLHQLCMSSYSLRH